MKEFFVDLGIEKLYFNQLHKQLLRAYRTGVKLSGNSIILDNEKAIGGIDFFSITDHISLLTLNVKFEEGVDIRRNTIKTPDFYSCLFSLKESVDLHAFNCIDEQEMNRIGFSAKHSALFFSSDVQTLFRVIPNETSKVIIILFTKDAIKDLSPNEDATTTTLFLGETTKGYAAMSPLMIDEVSMFFDFKLSLDLQKLFFWGSILRLLALLTHQVTLEGKRLTDQTGILEAVRLMQIRNLLVSDLSGSCPSIKEMADKAHMGLTKFKSAFKQMFKMPYYQYYQHYRLLAAKESLSIGKSVTETAYNFGFANLGHFSAAFKKKFKVAPSDI
jgi:AraC-like DNA-binding protein